MVRGGRTSPRHQRTSASPNQQNGSASSGSIPQEEFRILTNAIGDLQARIEALEGHHQERLSTIMLRCDNLEKAVGTALVNSNSQDISRAETLTSLYHSDTNGFRRNIRSSIREYMFSSNGSMYPDDNVKELASKFACTGSF